jgi:hypothetical protein
MKFGNLGKFGDRLFYEIIFRLKCPMISIIIAFLIVVDT